MNRYKELVKKDSSYKRAILGIGKIIISERLIEGATTTFQRLCRLRGWKTARDGYNVYLWRDYARNR